MTFSGTVRLREGLLTALVDTSPPLRHLSSTRPRPRSFTRAALSGWSAKMGRHTRGTCTAGAG